MELITAALAATATTLVSRQVAFVPCPPSDPITCPFDNGCLSTAANGAVFQVKCTTNYNGQVIEVNQVRQLLPLRDHYSQNTGSLNGRMHDCLLSHRRLQGPQLQGQILLPARQLPRRQPIRVHSPSPNQIPPPY